MGLLFETDRDCDARPENTAQMDLPVQAVRARPLRLIARPEAQVLDHVCEQVPANPSRWQHATDNLFTIERFPHPLAPVAHRQGVLATQDALQQRLARLCGMSLCNLYTPAQHDDVPLIAGLLLNCLSTGAKPTLRVAVHGFGQAAQAPGLTVLELHDWREPQAGIDALLINNLVLDQANLTALAQCRASAGVLILVRPCFSDEVPVPALESAGVDFVMLDTAHIGGLPAPGLTAFAATAERAAFLPVPRLVHERGEAQIVELGAGPSAGRWSQFGVPQLVALRTFARLQRLGMSGMQKARALARREAESLAACLHERGIPAVAQGPVVQVVGEAGAAFWPLHPALRVGQSERGAVTVIMTGAAPLDAASWSTQMLASQSSPCVPLKDADLAHPLAGHS